MHFPPLVSTCKQEGALGNFGTQRITNQIKATFNLTLSRILLLEVEAMCRIQGKTYTYALRHAHSILVTQLTGFQGPWMSGLPTAASVQLCRLGCPSHPTAALGHHTGPCRRVPECASSSPWTCVPQPCSPCPFGLWLYSLVALKPHPFHLQQFPLSLAASPSSFFSCTGSCKACFSLPGNCFGIQCYLKDGDTS